MPRQFFHSFEREGEGRERERERWFIHKLAILAGARPDLELHSDALCVLRDPRTQAIFHFFPKNIIRELDWKWSLRDSSASVWDASNTRGSLTHSITMLTPWCDFCVILVNSSHFSIFYLKPESPRKSVDSRNQVIKYDSYKMWNEHGRLLCACLKKQKGKVKVRKLIEKCQDLRLVIFWWTWHFASLL